MLDASRNDDTVLICSRGPDGRVLQYSIRQKHAATLLERTTLVVASGDLTGMPWLCLAKPPSLPNLHLPILLYNNNMQGPHRLGVVHSDDGMDMSEYSTTHIILGI